MILTQKLLQTLLHYEPDTGRLFWKERPREMFPTTRHWKSWNTRYAGQEALTALSNGYLCGQVLDNRYQAHRVIWCWVYGTWIDEVDHEDGDRSNNRIDNLRDGSHGVNSKNKKLDCRNKTGQMGVYFNKRKSLFHARIGKQHIGYYPTLVEATVARKGWEHRLDYHPNHGRAA